MRKLIFLLPLLVACSVFRPSHSFNISEQLKTCDPVPPFRMPQRAFGQQKTIWKKDTILYFYLGGSEILQKKIDALLPQWNELGRLKFVRTQSRQSSALRISFSRGGSWSYVGTDNLYVSKNNATMQFGWLTDQSSDDEIKRVVLHEFGHALGLQHEHQHPNNGIKWNKEVVYAYYARQGWNRSQVDQNLFIAYSSAQCNMVTYDPKSIMHYPVPKEHTMNGYSVAWNNFLSDGDKTWIKTYYPVKCECCK